MDASTVTVSYITAISGVLIVLINVTAAIVLAVLNRKANAVVKTINETHALVNSNMEAALLLIMEYASDKAKKEPTAVNNEAAKLARQKYEHHIQQAKRIDGKVHQPDAAEDKIEAEHKATVVETLADVKVVKQDVQAVKAELEHEVKDVIADVKQEVADLKAEGEKSEKKAN